MPNLTLEQALEEFPKECKVVLIAYGVDPKLWDSIYPVNVRRLCLEGGAGDDFLIAAALRWLAGKDKMAVSRGMKWPKDQLRALLEEVREQRKLETKK